MRYQRAELPLKLDGLAATRKFFAGCMADADPLREDLWVAHVDDQARCVHLSRFPGDETGAVFPLKAIVTDAAQHGSAGIVLTHNHPSGDPRPSDSGWRWPPDRPPRPPGACTLWVASKITGHPRDASCGSDRKSTTRVL